MASAATAPGRSIPVLCYKIHWALDMDRKYDVGRIAEVIKAAAQHEFAPEKYVGFHSQLQAEKSRRSFAVVRLQSQYRDSRYDSALGTRAIAVNESAQAVRRLKARCDQPSEIGLFFISLVSL